MMELFFIALFWFFLAIATGYAAKSRNRDGFGWFLLALLISPVIALLLLIAFRPLPEPTRDQIRTQKAVMIMAIATIIVVGISLSSRDKSSNSTSITPAPTQSPSVVKPQSAVNPRAADVFIDRSRPSEPPPDDATLAARMKGFQTADDYAEATHLGSSNSDEFYRQRASLSKK
jgi:hypothetical protein